MGTALPLAVDLRIGAESWLDFYEAICNSVTDVYFFYTRRCQAT